MIGMYLHHHGSGHRTRGTAIAQAMTHKVTGLGSGPAPRHWPGRWVELPRDHGDSEGAGEKAAYADPDASGVLHWAPLHHRGLRTRQALVVSWIASACPALMVVDTSVEVSLLARLCGVPVVVSAMPGDRRDRAHTSAYDLASALLAPWPQAAGNRDWPRAWVDKTWHAGGISRFEGRERVAACRVSNHRRVLVMWGQGGSDVSTVEVEQAQRATPGWTWVHRGGPYPPALDLWRELGEADVVVTHAGQNAVADVAAARRPAVVIAQHRPHGEQHATADAVQRLGAATGLHRWPEADQWPSLLDRAVSHGGEGWKAWSGPGAAGTGRWLDQHADTVAGPPRGNSR